MPNSERAISIFNPSVSNIGSIKSLFRNHEIKTYPIIVGDPVKTKSILICGVSGLQFNDIEYLSSLRKWIKSIYAEGKQIVGICAGMQMLFDDTEEVNQPLVGLLSGDIVKLNFTLPEVHTYIGFRDLMVDGDHSAMIRSYFSHGYGLIKNEKQEFDEHMTYSVNENESGIAYFRKKNILGFQFHPEKSSQEAVQFFLDKLDFGYAN